MVATNERKPPTLQDRDYQDQSGFRYAIRCFSRFSELQARREGITPQQYLLLLMVRGHPDYPHVSIGDVAERLQVRHHSASLLVERGVQRGLLDRVTDKEDRRRALVSLTADGQGILDRIIVANRRELGHMEDQIFGGSLVQALRDGSRGKLNR